MRKILIAAGAAVVLATVGVAAAVTVGAASRPGDCAGQTPSSAYRVRAADGNCLQGYVWAPAAAPRAVVVVVHGLHDHARRYEGLASALNGAGVAMLAQDHRGHGGSGGAAQRLDSLDQLLGDLELAVQEARKRFPAAPVVVYGHSLGGMVATHYVARQGDKLAGAVISSAALKRPANVSAGQARVVGALSAVAPGLGLEAVNAATLVREPAAQSAVMADPLISKAKLPARTVGTLFDGIGQLEPKLGSIGLPLLILHGQGDALTDPAGSRALHERAASRVKQLKLYDRALHDLLHEPEGAEVAREVVAFVTARAGQP